MMTIKQIIAAVRRTSRLATGRLVDVLNPVYDRCVIFGGYAHILVSDETIDDEYEDAACEICSLEELCRQTAKRKDGRVLICEDLSGDLNHVFIKADPTSKELIKDI